MKFESIEKKFGNILREKRKSAGITQEDLAFSCDLDRTYISLLERGLRQPTLVTLFKLCEQLKIEPHALIQQLEQSK